MRTGWGLAIFLNKAAEAGLEQTNAANPRGASAKILARILGRLWERLSFLHRRFFPIGLCCPKIVPSHVCRTNEMRELVFDIGSTATV
jgi:hypothetical protein